MMSDAAAAGCRGGSREGAELINQNDEVLYALPPSLCLHLLRRRPSHRTLPTPRP